MILDSKTKILFLTADPSNASRLRLGEEQREIHEKLRLSNLRDQFIFEVRSSVRPGDITQAIHDVHPNILHFSGHGTTNGELCLEDESGRITPINSDALADLFNLVANQVYCVILNACYSESQALTIATYINYVIGMKKEIGDKAAIAFSTGFYRALGGGRSIEESFKFGLLELKLLNIEEHLTPSLFRKDAKSDNKLNQSNIENMESLKLMPNNEKILKARTYLKNARNSYNQKDYNKAENLLEVAFQLDPSSNGIKGLLGRVWLRIGKFDQCIEILSSALPDINIKANKIIIQKNRGIAYLLQQQYTKALEDFSAAYKEYPYDEMAYRLASLTWIYLGNLDIAEDLINKSLSITPKYPCGRATKSIIFWLKDEKDKSMREIKKASQYSNGDPNDFYCIAVAYNVLGMFEISIKTLSTVIKQDIRYYYWAINDPFLKDIREKIHKLI